MEFSFLYFILIGLVAGWLGGRIMRGSGFGLIGNLVVGVIGAVLGGWLLGVLGFASQSNSLLASLVTATIGAVVLLFLIGLVTGRGSKR
jgi:uncharacterized membrane protein YeaQ/YmgE (transglycosylase-associated protein family)